MLRQPTLEVPAVRHAADASERVVTLRTPKSAHHIYRLVERLFLAITSESNVGGQTLLAEGSVVRFAGGESQSAFVSWVRRFGSSEYTTLRGAQL
ncbi:MAG: hypothetical protein RJA70_3444, partial [Pseudomonadota bacterium]